MRGGGASFILIISVNIIPGKRSGKKGRISEADGTSLHMLSIITAHLRFTAFERSASPRASSGIMTARSGARTALTKVVWDSLSIVSGTNAGSPMHLTTSIREGREKRDGVCEREM